MEKLKFYARNQITKSLGCFRGNLWNFCAPFFILLVSKFDRQSFWPYKFDIKLSQFIGSVTG